jgi:hypothetical protein
MTAKMFHDEDADDKRILAALSFRNTWSLIRSLGPVATQAFLEASSCQSP